MAANVNRYIAAGNAAISSATNIINSLATFSPNYAGIANEGIVATSKTKATEILNKSKEKIAEKNADTNIELLNMAEDTSKKIRQDKKQVQMAGKLAAGASLIGFSQLYKRQKDEPNPLISQLQNSMSQYDQRIKDATAQVSEANEKLKALGTKSDPSEKQTDTLTVPTGENSNTGASQYQGLTGNTKILADSIAGPESGPWEYEAFNQGGTNKGRGVVGKSGSYKDTYGSSLTDMTLDEIFYKQNTKARGLSMDEHLASGGLHAVGRYQFIGPTLQSEVAAMGLDPKTTKFSPQIQDQIFLSHAKRVGNISPWVGPMDQYSSQKREELNSIISGL